MIVNVHPKEDEMQTETTLTPDSMALFLNLAGWAGDWSGTPLVDVTPAQRGNLTHLKRADLLDTFDDGGCVFARFTAAGVKLATENGVDLTWLTDDPYVGPTR